MGVEDQDSSHLKSYSVAAQQTPAGGKTRNARNKNTHSSEDDMDCLRLKDYSRAAHISSSQNSCTSKKRQVITIADSDEELEQPKPKAKKKADPSEEKRLKLFRKRCPAALNEKLERARSQRMFVLGRARDTTSTVPSETFDVAGSTGNIYQVFIGRIPSCTCPDSQKNGTCKHILYVLTKVLKVRTELSYQAAFLSTELREIFSNAAPPSDGSISDHLKTRKPLDEDECPICYEAFDDEKDTVFCKAQCGTNIHKECFRKWAASQNGKNVTCVMCRSSWQAHEDMPDTTGLLAKAKAGEEGYMNVGQELGLGATRDWSSYNSYGMYNKFGRSWRNGGRGGFRGGGGERGRR